MGFDVGDKLYFRQVAEGRYVRVLLNNVNAEGCFLIMKALLDDLLSGRRLEVYGSYILSNG